MAGKGNKLGTINPRAPYGTISPSPGINVRGATLGEIPAWMKAERPITQQVHDVGTLAATGAINLAPGIDDILSAQEALTGVDRRAQIVGELMGRPAEPQELGWLGRGLSGLGVLPFVPGAVKHIAPGGGAMGKVSAIKAHKDALSQITDRLNNLENKYMSKYNISQAEFDSLPDDHPIIKQFYDEHKKLQEMQSNALVAKNKEDMAKIPKKEPVKVIHTNPNITNKTSHISKGEDAIVFYRGAPEGVIEHFDPSYLGHNFGDRRSQYGFFLTESENLANFYGEVGKYRVKANKPMLYDVEKAVKSDYQLLKKKSEVDMPFKEFVSDYLEGIGGPYGYIESGEMQATLQDAVGRGHDALVMDFGGLKDPKFGKLGKVVVTLGDHANQIELIK
jgi:hypothetical protein